MACRTMPYYSKPCMALVKGMTSRRDKALLGVQVIADMSVTVVVASYPR